MKVLSPIVKKDIEVRSRSYTLPIILIAANGLLFLVGLMGTFGLVAKMKQSSETFYRSFLTVYALTAATEFLITVITAPLFTAASISGERQTGTFDLLLTTNLTPAEIVLEKLTGAFLSVGMIIMSSLPALTVPLMFGGVGLADTIYVLFIFLPGAFLMLSVGMFASSVSSNVTKSIAISYIIVFVITAGFILLPLMTRLFSAENGNKFAYLMVFDPFITVMSVITRQIGEPEITELIFEAMRLSPDSAFTGHIVLISTILQLALASGFIFAAIINIMPGRYREKSRKIRER